MKTKLILFTVIALFFLNGCGDKFCPGLPDEYADYFPYKKGQIIEFANNKSDTIEWTILNISQAIDHYVPTCGKCECGEQLLWFTAETNNYFFVEGGITFSQNELLFAFIYSYSNKIFPNHFDRFYKSYKINVLTPNIGVENANEVVRISRIEIEKSKGFISFYDTELDCEWKLVENN